MLYISKEGNRAMSRQILKKEHIITDRLTLGPYRKEDRERLTEMMRNPEITATFMVPDYSEEVQFYALADKLIEFSQINDTAHLEYGVYLFVFQLSQCFLFDELTILSPNFEHLMAISITSFPNRVDNPIFFRRFSDLFKPSDVFYFLYKLIDYSLL